VVNDTGAYSLNVGSGNVFLITVIAEDATQRSYTITVTRAAPVVAEAPEVLAVTVSPSAVSLPAGATQQFTANVAVAGGAAQTVAWSVSGNTSASTIIAAGMLIVGANETAATLTVTATSAFDNTKSGSATVAVTAAPTGVDNQLTVAAALYPNPFADELHLAGAEGCALRVISASGATVYTRLLTSTNEAIRLENLPSGLYFYYLNLPNNT
jgi:hypothetical protein